MLPLLWEGVMDLDNDIDSHCDLRPHSHLASPVRAWLMHGVSPDLSERGRDSRATWGLAEVRG